MKRMIFLVLVLTATGCIELPIRPDPDATFMKSAKTAAPKVPATAPVKETPIVTPEQVSDGNAPQMLDALHEELDHAAGERTAGPKP